eukprot:Plantae.Rhodophyta-Hildenbrandia_rubra.ctg4410.p1 GENE.Plantae.Rhodophyta-Hildenbrandia_rubra.ctg4410~~Plantae.Rhodophyta-Hildenbrandia_rubra.ctg4410.p1  ORF type:complete len:533 (-),score=69.84 Plantae.Rhodophyta-Hildenbrandia_rubra.ctg4410:1968-3566(-)
MSRGARGSHEEALSLVRRMSPSKTGWTYARQIGRFSVLWRGYKRCWAELRGNTLLLYVIPEPGAPGGIREELPPKSRSPSNALLIPLKNAKVCKPKKEKFRIKRHNDAVVEVVLKNEKEAKKWHRAVEGAVKQRRIGLSDFKIVGQVGKGASGRVYLVRDKDTGESLALKVIEKSSVYENTDAYRHALDERLVLEMACDHPFILDLRYAFQTRKRLYLVTEYCDGGDLFEFLKKRGRPFREPKARLIAAEILLALEHIHGMGVVYRDLKLENVLLDLDGHIRIADFGLSKLLWKRKDSANTHTASKAATGSAGSGADSNTMTKTFCGTREYVAPEMLNGHEYGQSVDLWAFGILLYEILCGRTPFYSKHRDEVYDRIENAQLKFPRHLSSDVESLIRGLLDRNPQTRLGLGPDGILAIKGHTFFADVNWESVYQRKPNNDRIRVDRRRVKSHSNIDTYRIGNNDRLKEAELSGLNLEGEDADVLLEETLQDERESRKPDILAMFASNKKKKTDIPGYSFVRRGQNNSPSQLL